MSMVLFRRGDIRKEPNLKSADKSKIFGTCFEAQMIYCSYRMSRVLMNLAMMREREKD
jgi:hypothetical protein